jgi:pyruvate kinase
MYRGVLPIAFDTDSAPSADDFVRAIAMLKAQGTLADGDLVIVSSGDTTLLGGTNTMKILRVDDTMK